MSALLYCGSPCPSCHLSYRCQLLLGPNPLLAASVVFNTNEQQCRQAEWQSLFPIRAPPPSLSLVFIKPSSQAPAASLKSSLYAGLHLYPPLAVAVEPHGRTVWRRHREWREVWQASRRGMAFLLSCPE